MTDQPTDRIDEIDQRLESLEENLASYRTSSEQSTQELRTLTAELLSIAQLHQQALRFSQEENRRIWQYLLGRQGNGNGGS